MPLYEYKCHSCGRTFEVIQKFSDEPIRIHEECGGETERLISATAFHLKGSGWYATDYAKGNGNAPKPGDPKPGDSKSGDSAIRASTKSTKDKSSESGSEKTTLKNRVRIQKNRVKRRNPIPARLRAIRNRRHRSQSQRRPSRTDSK